MIYAYYEKKGLLCLSLAVTIEYYGAAPRQIGLHEGTMLIASYGDGSKYVLHGITLDEINRAIIQGTSKTFFITWERLGPPVGPALQFE